MKKSIAFYIFTIALYGMIFLTVASCNKRNDQQAHMTVKMTDAPANYLAVNVDIQGLSIHTTNAGWVNLPVQSGVYDLLLLQNDVTVVLANNVVVPTGKVTQMRLHLGPNNTIVTTTGTYPLKVPSGEQSGLKVNINAHIFGNSNMVIVLDFDAAASVVENGNGDYTLKPVIKLHSITP